MLNFFNGASFNNFAKLLRRIFSRFPLSAILSVLAFVTIYFTVYFSDMLSNSLEETLFKIFIVLIVSFLFSVAMYLHAEGKRDDTFSRHYYQLATFVFGFLFYYFFDEGLFQEERAMIYVALTVLGILSFLFVSKYFRKFLVRADSQNDFYVSAYSLAVKIAMSAIVGVVTMILGFIAIMSLFALFEVVFLDNNNWYAYWSSFSLVLFAPFFFLANLPKIDADVNNGIEWVASNKFYAFLVNYVGLPAICIYFIILYAYTIKVLINFSQWPQGEVVWMVILFSFFGYLIYFASFAFAENFWQARIFRKILPIAVLLQIPMLFYAIGLRINQYDLTINRYLVLVFGFWLLFLSLYYAFSLKKDLSIIPYSLLVVVILMSIGPWSVYVFPKWRQSARLERNLIQANILQNGKIVPLGKYNDIDFMLSRDIYGGIEYLCNFHGCESLNSVFAKEIADITEKDRKEFESMKNEHLEDARLINNAVDTEIAEKEKYKGVDSYTVIRELTSYIKVGFNGFEYGGEEPEYLIFENNVGGDFFERNVVVGGYDFMVRLSQLGGGSGSDSDEEYHITLNPVDAKLGISKGETLLDVIDINKDVVQKIINNEDKYIYSDFDYTGTKAKLENSDMTFEFEGEKFAIKLIFQTISIKNPKWSQVSGESDLPRDFSHPRIDGYALIREKK